MKKSLTLSLAAAALVATGSTAAFADNHARGGDHTRAEAEAKAAKAFARMDANGDGALNAADREAHARKRFAAADSNGDGLLSFEETQAAREAHKAKRAERRAEMGANAGERRGRGEGKMHRRGGHRGKGKGAMAMLKRADTNGDQSVSQAEFTAAMLARFDAADANSDGTVTAEERKAARAEMRGKMHERMKERRAQQAG